MSEEFRSLVNEQLAAQQISRAELARRLGIKPPTITQYLNGETVPGTDVIERFLNALGFQPHIVIERLPAESRKGPKRALQAAS